MVFWDQLFPLSVFSRIARGAACVKAGVSVSFVHPVSAKLKTEPDPWTVSNTYVLSE